ncbi:hypothetical protein GE09DRAFT_1085897 [Coniochaeta sp. 2T2.1]|nr:hypothetical protein GE09DRAFT_1085897 [Coniochaeta sp. 2T2.1]
MADSRYMNIIASSTSQTDLDLQTVSILSRPPSPTQYHQSSTHHSQNPRVMMGGGPESTPCIGELRDLLTPSFLTEIVRARLPYDKHASIDLKDFGRNIFLVDPISPEIKSKVWRVLIALSKIGVDQLPDLTTYLPPLSDPSYLEQWTGLILLVDHFPRLLFRGIDERWTYGYFRPISYALCEVWRVIPESDRPDSWDNAKKHMGLDYWICTRFWLGTPFVHAEKLELQRLAVEVYTMTTREVVEAETGTRDQHRDEREEILGDLVGFPREYRKSTPMGDSVTNTVWTYWMCALMDIHWPIIEHFGRYPYLNAIKGRESTEEEFKWIEEVCHFGECHPAVAKRVREDVEAGRWTPLGTDSLGPNANKHWAAGNVSIERGGKLVRDEH